MNPTSFIVNKLPTQPPTFVTTTKAGQAPLARPASDTEIFTAESDTESKTTKVTIDILEYIEFSNLLTRAKHSSDPFETLRTAFHDKGDYHTHFIRLESGVYVECQVTTDEFASNCFMNEEALALATGKKPSGPYRFIEMYTYHPETGVTDEKHLLSIWMDKHHEVGGWAEINGTPQMKGRDSKRVAEKLSRSMKIKDCFLADNAQTLSASGKRKIDISLPLQIMGQPPYYAPTFSLFNTPCPIPSDIIINDETGETYAFSQNSERHAKKLKKLQETSVQALHDDILIDRKSAQSAFKALVRRYNPEFTFTLHELVKTLYETSKTGNKKALKDYEWVCFNLLNTQSIPGTTEAQRKYGKALEIIFFSKLYKADFSE